MPSWLAGASAVSDSSSTPPEKEDKSAVVKDKPVEKKPETKKQPHSEKKSDHSVKKADPKPSPKKQEPELSNDAKDLDALTQIEPDKKSDDSNIPDWLK